jgi:hypothetical protein
MLPALKSILSTILCVAAGNFFCCPEGVFAQNSDRFTSLSYAIFRSSNAGEQNQVEDELALYGKLGQLISRARVHTIAILSSENSCSIWYRRAIPSPGEMFETLRFEVDSSGQSEIFRVEGALGDFEFFHPYVAHAGQDVGPGSTITLNANGAFFKDRAAVRFLNGPQDPFSKQSMRPLTVADFFGDTEPARILTLLHEFGHIIDLLPLDSGSPGAAFLSVGNTQAVLKNCKSQIELEAKRVKPMERKHPKTFLAATALQTPRNSVKPPPAYSSFRPRQ